MMFIIQYTLAEEEYDKWITEEYHALNNALFAYEAYYEDEKYDQVRLMMVMQSVYK